MSSFWVWVAALGLYALFLAWYVNWRGPLSAAEVTDLIGRMRAASIGRGGADELPTLERFLAEDDGREFFMLNVIRMADGPVADPATGALKPVREVMEGYTRMFLPALFRRGGHPALAARLDAWRAALSASIPEEPADD